MKRREKKRKPVRTRRPRRRAGQVREVGSLAQAILTDTHIRLADKYRVTYSGRFGPDGDGW